jgi:hypothetical protein
MKRTKNTSMKHVNLYFFTDLSDASPTKNKYTTIIISINSSFFTSLSKSSSIKKFIRQFSTKSSNTNNLDLDKGRILQENNQKSGVYMFTNLINGKRYVGSS